MNTLFSETERDRERGERETETETDQKEIREGESTNLNSMTSGRTRVWKRPQMCLLTAELPSLLLTGKAMCTFCSRVLRALWSTWLVVNWPWFL